MPSTIMTRIVRLPLRWKRAILIFFDFTVLIVAAWASFALRLDQWALPRNLDAWMTVLSAPVVAIPIFVRMGLYRAVVRYLPERALWTMIRAVTLAVLTWAVVIFLTQLMIRSPVPRSVPIIYWAFACMVIAGSRFAAKRLLWPGTQARRQLPAVVIYGAGDAGTQLALSLQNSRFVVGFVDDNTSLHRREVAGLRVYPPAHLDVLVRDYGVKQLILSIPSLLPTRRKEIVASMSGHGVSILSLPAMTDLVTGNYLVSQVREIDITDLLGRSPVPPNLDLIREMIVGRTIMVTGAGGSIGSELCRKIAHWRPQRLVLFEANEFALYRIERELSSDAEVSIIPVLGSVVDAQRVTHAITEHGVEVIFHAAAHKHVPLVEANALEGIKNNVFGTSVVADAAFDNNVRDFVLISTDKAVRPTNVMGATKRWAELIVQRKANLAAEGQTGQRFCAVRFGNVLGSNGSVVPLFKEQIARGGPVTLTDPAMTRYFMSIHEAAELIVQAGSLSSGGDVFLLDMGQPVLIADLAKNMIQLAGLTVRSAENPEGDIEITATGRRPGEKMYEELFYDEANASSTKHPKILRASNTTFPTLQGMCEELRASLDREDEASARKILFDVVTQSDKNHQA